MDKIYGQSKNGNIICLGMKGEGGDIVGLPMKKSTINSSVLEGETIVFYNIKEKQQYNIKILEYIKGTHPKFLIQNSQLEKKIIECTSFLRNCNIQNLIPKEKNTFKRVDNYYIMGIKTKGTKSETDFNGQNVEILFDGTEKVVKGIMNSTWYLFKQGITKDTYYIQTSNYNQTGQAIKLHQIVFNQTVPKGYVINHINRTNGSWRDNRLSNLELTTSKKNAKNRAGAGYPSKTNKKWRYQIVIDGFNIATPVRQDYKEVDIDALIVQEYFGYTHRANEFYKIKNIDQNYKDSLIQLMKQKLEKAKQTQGKFTKNKYEIIQIEGIEVIKICDNKDRYCLIDKEDLWILDLGRAKHDKRGYWSIRVNNIQYALHRYLLGIKETDRFHNLQVDHINQNPCDNRKNNLRITTELGNKINKQNKNFYNKNKGYRARYYGYWDYISNHSEICKIKEPTFSTKQQAIEETVKRKWLANYIRPQFRNLDEYIVFEEDYKQNKKDGQTLDDYWIQVKFKDINEIKIPNNLEECEEK